MKIDSKEFDAKMKKSIAAYENELADIRAGRAVICGGVAGYRRQDAEQREKKTYFTFHCSDLLEIVFELLYINYITNFTYCI